MGPLKTALASLEEEEIEGLEKIRSYFFLSTRLVLYDCIVVTNHDKFSSLKPPRFTVAKSGTQRLQELCFGSPQAEIGSGHPRLLPGGRGENTFRLSSVRQNLVLRGCRTEVSVAWLAVHCGVILSFERLTGFLPVSVASFLPHLFSDSSWKTFSASKIGPIWIIQDTFPNFRSITSITSAESLLSPA